LPNTPEWNELDFKSPADYAVDIRTATNLSFLALAVALEAHGAVRRETFADAVEHLQLDALDHPGIAGQLGLLVQLLRQRDSTRS